MERGAPLRPGPADRAGVRNTVLAAAALAFVLDALLQPPLSPVGLVGRLVGFSVGALLAFLAGRWLGTRTWPRRGRRVARWMLRRALRHENKQLLFVCDRPDFPPRTSRRVLEVVGFAAGASVLFASAVVMLGLSASPLAALAVFFALISLWASFVLVPYWLFARIGLRRVDPVLWLVEPMSRRYADRLRLSNGALLLIAVGAVFNLAFRAGASGDAALVDGVRVVASIAATVLVAAASGVAFYNLKERALLREFEDEALALGIRDGRGMSDGDFLPRLPAVGAKTR